MSSAVRSPSTPQGLMRFALVSSSLAVASVFGLAAVPMLSAQVGSGGVVWRRRTTDPAPFGPGTQANYEVTYDGARGEMVLVSSVEFDTVWLWDGVTMRREIPSVAPPARVNHQMCFDPVRNVVVLHGGRPSLLGIVLDDTWEWDGADWTLVNPSGGPAGARFSEHEFDMAFDSVRGTCVLYLTEGGLGETWEWDGTRWTQLATLSSPMILRDSFRDQQMITHPESGRAVCITLERPAVLYELRDGPQGLDWVPLPSTIDHRPKPQPTGLSRQPVRWTRRRLVRLGL